MGQITFATPGEYHGRMSLAANAVTQGDVLAATTIFFVPFKGNTFSCYNGNDWITVPFTTFQMAVPAVANQHYDVYLFLNSDLKTLGHEFVAWASDTVRSVGVAIKDGAVVKSGDPTRKYIGSIRTLVAGQTEDSSRNRLVRNHDNHVKRVLSLKCSYTGADAVVTIPVTNTSWATVNGGVDATIRYLSNSEGPIEIAAVYSVKSPVSNEMYVGVGDSSTTTALLATRIGKGETDGGTIRVSIQKLPGCYTVNLLAKVDGGVGLLYTNYPFSGGVTAPYGLSLEGSVNG